jgi:hypothetical protein
MKKKTDYDNVYWIPKGFEYHPNEFAEIDGYIWYDETEQSSPVYSSAEQAKEALRIAKEREERAQKEFVRQSQISRFGEEIDKARAATEEAIVVRKEKQKAASDSYSLLRGHTVRGDRRRNAILR